MTDVVAAAAVRGHPRAVPLAMLYVGIPAYLIVSGLSVWDIVTSHSPAVATVAVVSVGAFSVTFLWLALAPPHPRSPRRVIGALAVMAVLAAGLALLGTTTAVYLITVAAMAGDALVGRLALPVILLATGGVALYSVANEGTLEDILTETVVPLVVGLFAFGLARLNAANLELMAAREEVATLAVANERLRFARDLHDLLGHSLTVMRAKSELAARLVDGDPERARSEMEEVEQLARQALVDAREAISGYRHSTLASELANGRVALRSAGIEVDVAVDGVPADEEIDETLGWVLREAVTNVVRHSGAARCRVEAAPDGDGIRLEVADDGHGPSTDGDPQAGSGLVGLHERLAAVGGTLDVGPAPGGGFRMVAWVPRPT